MDNSANQSFTISSNEPLLPHQNLPKQTVSRRKKYLKPILISILVLVILMATVIFKMKKLEPSHASRSKSKQYYCYTTRYPELCYDSMSSIINTTLVDSKPGLIFSASIQAPMNQLSYMITNITADDDINNSSTIIGLGFSKCGTCMHNASARLNESLSILGVDSHIESLTYEEMSKMVSRAKAAQDEVFKCFSALDEIKTSVAEGDERRRVEEVRSGVAKARKLIVNCIELLVGSEFIVFDLYNPSDEGENYYYYTYYSYYNF